MKPTPEKNIPVPKNYYQPAQILRNGLTARFKNSVGSPDRTTDHIDFGCHDNSVDDQKVNKTIANGLTKSAKTRLAPEWLQAHPREVLCQGE